MININIVKSQKNTKRGRAIITFLKSGEIKSVNFGSKRGFTFFDGADELKKKNYIARHKASGNQDWSDPLTAGFYSRWVLWSHPKSQIDKIKDEIKNNSKVEVNKITFGKDFK
jgi:hypothetical protein